MTNYDESAKCTVSQLVEQHYTALYRYAYRLTGSSADAEDLTQQAFMTAHAKWDQLRTAEHARSWLFTILRNDFLKSLRPRSRAGVISLESVPEPTSSGPLNTDIDLERLQLALDDLPDEFRTPLMLYYFEELSYKQIAEQMDTPIGTVMSRLARAKTYLRGRLASADSSLGQNPPSRIRTTH